MMTDWDHVLNMMKKQRAVKGDGEAQQSQSRFQDMPSLAETAPESLVSALWSSGESSTLPLTTSSNSDDSTPVAKTLMVSVGVQTDDDLFFPSLPSTPSSLPSTPSYALLSPPPSPFLASTGAATGIKRFSLPVPQKAPGHMYTYCVFCQNNGESESYYMSHTCKDEFGRVECPVLRAYVCPICKASGSKAHTIKYCPRNKMNRVKNIDIADITFKMNSMLANRPRSFGLPVAPPSSRLMPPRSPFYPREQQYTLQSFNTQQYYMQE